MSSVLPSKGAVQPYIYHDLSLNLKIVSNLRLRNRIKRSTTYCISPLCLSLLHLPPYLSLPSRVLVSNFSCSLWSGTYWWYRSGSQGVTMSPDFLLFGKRLNQGDCNRSHSIHPRLRIFRRGSQGDIRCQSLESSLCDMTWHVGVRQVRSLQTASRQAFRIPGLPIPSRGDR